MYRVITDDQYFLAIDKLAPIPCIRLGDKAGLSDELILSNPELIKLPDFGFTHRLDNETLGAVLVAKSLQYYEAIRTLFKEKKMNKTYHARVTGIVPSDSGIIDLPIAHSDKSKKKMLAVRQGYRVGFRGKPRPAVTEWKVITKHAECTDMELKTHTGVRHQIRIHMKSIGHPICGDDVYGGTSQGFEAPSLMLISKSIQFECPIRKTPITIYSTLSLDSMFSSYNY